MGKKIDLTMMSAHVIVERAQRIKHIENSIGWGTIIVKAPDRNEKGCYRALTSTGVLLVIAENGMVITLWIAGVNQAKAVWKKAKGDKPFPHWLWNVVNYNNNTYYWKQIAA